MMSVATIQYIPSYLIFLPHLSLRQPVQQNQYTKKHDNIELVHFKMLTSFLKPYVSTFSIHAGVVKL